MLRAGGSPPHRNEVSETIAGDPPLFRPVRSTPPTGKLIGVHKDKPGASLTTRPRAGSKLKRSISSPSTLACPRGRRWEGMGRRISTGSAGQPARAANRLKGHNQGSVTQSQCLSRGVQFTALSLLIAKRRLIETRCAIFALSGSYRTIGNIARCRASNRAQAIGYQYVYACDVADFQQ